MALSIAPCKGIRIPEYKKVLLVESRIQENLFALSGILSFGIQNTAQGMQNSSKDWNAESKFH